jgi:hypothetical protein
MKRDMELFRSILLEVEKGLGVNDFGVPVPGFEASTVTAHPVVR